MQKVKIEPFNLIGISIKTINENGQSAKDIAALWNKFMSENISDKIPNKIDNTVYSLYKAQNPNDLKNTEVEFFIAIK